MLPKNKLNNSDKPIDFKTEKYLCFNCGFVNEYYVDRQDPYQICYGCGVNKYEAAMQETILKNK